MAMARNLRRFAARPRMTISQNAPERAFCTVAEAGKSQPLTLANLGFTADGQDVEFDSSRTLLRDGGRSHHKRSSEKAPLKQTRPVTDAPSAEEMKQAALEASYILAGIAGMRIPKPKKLAGSEAANAHVEGPLQLKEEVAAAAAAAEKGGGEGEEEGEEERQQELNAKVEMAAVVVEEATEPAKGLNLNHPWPVWIEFLTDLQTKGFFEGSEEGVDEGKHLFESYAAVKHAAYAFGRTHSEIFKCLSRKDLRVLANFGCPDVERKASNASKRLRVHFRILEGDVCQRCRWKMTCPRAFFAPEANMRMNTLDVVRIITGFASNAWPNADNHTSYPSEVGTSVCNLLREFLTYQILPKKTSEDEYIHTERSSVLEPDPNARKKVKNIPPADPKPGDWACPNCEYLNFNRNRRCRECHVFQPQQELNAYIGDWHCPKCRYLNFSKNRYCRECNMERPTKVKWMGGERLPDDHLASDKLASKERKYEASDDEEASDVSLTNPDESSISDGSLSEEEERALSRGLSNAARKLAKPTFRWEEIKEKKDDLFDSSHSKKGLKSSIMKSDRVIERTLRKKHVA